PCGAARDRVLRRAAAPHRANARRTARHDADLGAEYRQARARGALAPAAGGRTPMTPRDAVVVGGGISGLASAALLAADGHRVTLLESRDAFGGRAGSWQHGGFRFDTGPSWFLMPEVFEHFYRLLGTSMAEQLELHTLDPGYRAYFEGDPQAFDLPAGSARARAALTALDPASEQRLA